MLPIPPFEPAHEDLFERHGDDLRVLEEKIVARFTEIGVRRMLYYKNWDWDNNIAPGAFSDRVFMLIDYLKRLRQLHWLVYLVAQERPDDGSFAMLRDRLTPPLPAPGGVPLGPRESLVQRPEPAPGVETSADGDARLDPWKMVLLNTAQPFLDRTTFRDDCRVVSAGFTRPILSVSGAPDTGKSYTARYLAGVSKALGGEGFVTKEIRLDRLNGFVDEGARVAVDGLRLARRLSLAITDEPLPEYFERTIESEQETAWAADAVNWIVSAAKDTPLRWVVFDGFELAVLAPAADAVIHSLVAEVAASRKVRIALLGYRGDLSWSAASVRHVVLELDEFRDPVQLQRHVINYLLEIRSVAELRNRPSYTYDQLEQDVRNVLSRVNPAMPDLCSLEAALTEIAERVLVGA